MILKINKLDCTIYLYKYYMVYASVSYGHKMLTNNYILHKLYYAIYIFLVFLYISY